MLWPVEADLYSGLVSNKQITQTQREREKFNCGQKRREDGIGERKRFVAKKEKKTESVKEKRFVAKKEKEMESVKEKVEQEEMRLMTEKEGKEGKRQEHVRSSCLLAGDLADNP